MIATPISDLPARLRRRLVEAPPDGPAVYFLIADGAVIYVGSSTQPRTRVRKHEIPHTSALFLPTKPDEQKVTEKHWIGRLRPPHNGNCLDGNGLPVQFRLGDDTLAELNYIREHYGLPTRSATITFMARRMAADISRKAK